MISTCDPKIAYWDEDGKSFTVFNRKLLARKEIPKHFIHSNYSSFERSSRSYMFKRESVLGENGEIYHRYSHPYFIKDQPKLLQMIAPRKRHSPHTQKKGAADIFHTYPAQPKNSVDNFDNNWKAYHDYVVGTLQHQVEQLSSRLSILQHQVEDLSSGPPVLLDSNGHLQQKDETMHKQLSSIISFDRNRDDAILSWEL